jgi:hypothetical protein
MGSGVRKVYAERDMDLVYMVLPRTAEFELEHYPSWRSASST